MNLAHKLVLSVCVMVGSVGVAGAQKVYFTDYGDQIIYRANLDGTNPETLVASGLSLPLGIDLDLVAGKMYLSDPFGVSIQRANLDGTMIETLVTGISNIDALALDVPAGKMYWTEEAGNIQRANLDGTMVEFLRGGLAIPVGIDLDPGAGKMYWTELGGGTLGRSNLDGSMPQIVYSGGGGMAGVELDLVGGKMYWTEQSRGIKRANLDGTLVETLISSGLSSPSGIDLDIPGGKMYFTNQDGRIMRSNLNGTAQQVIFTGNRCYGIALDPRPPPAPPPTCTLAITSIPPHGDDVAMELQADSASALTVDVLYELSTDSGASWATAQAAIGSSNPQTAVPILTPTPFVWDSRGDAVGLVVLATGVLIRATVDDGVSATPGDCMTPPFDVDNTMICIMTCGNCNQSSTGPDIIDALVAAQIAAGLIVPTATQQACCDVNTSGGVDILDALLIAQSAAGLAMTLMCA